MKIILLYEPGFPSRGLSGDLVGMLRQYPDLTVEVMDIAAIVAGGIPGDFFCNGHGEVYPIEIEERLLEFVREGGGLLHLGGAPFETAMTRSEGGWTPVTRTFGDTRNHTGPGAQEHELDVLRAKLGIMTYAPAYPIDDTDGLRQVFDADLFAGAPQTGNLPVVGVTVTTTIPLYLARPELYLNDHRAYQAKPLCRESHCAGSLVTPEGVPLITSLSLTKCWGNPYQANQHVVCRPWAIYTGMLEGDIPHDILRGMLDWLATPVFLRNIELERSTIHPGETVSVSVEMAGNLPEGWKIRGYRGIVSMRAFLAGEAIRWKSCPIEVSDHGATLQVSDAEDAFLLPVRFAVVDAQDRVRDYTESAVVPWRPELLATAPRVTTNGQYFDVHIGQHVRPSCWVSGTNWQDRHQFAFTWHNPNPLRIAHDAQAMADAGMLFVRPHYFMPGWMRTVPGEVYQSLCPEAYEHFELGPEITERHMRAIEAHVMLFGRLGLALMPSLYTNVSPNMGNPQNWMGTSRLVGVPALRENQQRFARQIMARFGDIPCLTWDLCNEIDTAFSQVGDWVRDLAPTWLATGQMVGVGTFQMAQNMVLGESVDWHSIHIACCKVTETFHTGKPCVLQEAWVPTPATADGEADLEYYLNRGISWTLRFGGAGFMPWNWNMLLPNWRAGGSFVEYWDNELGCAVHGDATPRRGRTALRNWAFLLEGLSFDQSRNDQVVFIYPKCGLEGAGTTECLDILHHLRIPFRAVNDVDFADFDLAHTRLVIAPYFGVGFRDASWRKLRDFAFAGGTVWAHNDAMATDEQGQFSPDRMIPLLGGEETIGDGNFYWVMGWNSGGQNQQTFFKRMLDDLDLARNPVNTLPLTMGQLRFSERWSTDEKTMKTDWSPLAKLPDRNVVIKVEIADGQDVFQRGWSGEGVPFSVDGLVISSPSSLFCIRQSPGSYLLAAREVRISGSAHQPKATLVDWRHLTGMHPLETRLHWKKEEDDWVLHLTGWQSLHWVAIQTR